MRCQQVEELLPLYVEGDLEAEALREVAAHLDGCKQCATLAEDFNASQAWLHEHSLPDFDERFFADLKSNVMREISQQAPHFSFRQWLFPRLYLKPVWATVLLLMILGGLAIYFYQHKAMNTNPPDVAKSQEKQPASASQDSPVSVNPVEQPTVPMVTDVKNRRTRIPHHPQFGMRFRHAEQPAREVPQQTTEPTYIASGKNDSTDLNVMTNNTTAPEMTRIEFQTNDPKIRIIWFVPKTTDMPKIDTE